MMFVVWGGAQCSEKKFKFSTLTEAQAAGELRKGWIPPVLPAGSNNISYTNNLDLNTAQGTFSYDQKHLESFTNKVRDSYDAIVFYENDRVRIEFSNEKIEWSIVFPEKLTVGTFNTRLTEKIANSKSKCNAVK